MKPKLDFAEWLKQEMTTTASIGGTFTNDIANFSRPLFSGAVGRNWADLSCEDDEEEKSKKRKKTKKD